MVATVSTVINILRRRILVTRSGGYDFFPQDFMHILYSDLHVGPA